MTPLRDPYLKVEVGYKLIEEGKLYCGSLGVVFLLSAI